MTTATNPKTLLVTGGAGFIGTNFVHHAVRNNYRVVNVDALTYAGNIENLDALSGNPLYTFCQADICDEAKMSELLCTEKPRALINFAAESHVDRSIDGPRAFMQTNIMGVFSLLEAVRRNVAELPEAFRMVQVSTDEVYGSLTEGAFHEASPFAPNSPYAASKASGDHLVRAYNRTYGLPLVITNCSNNYGPYQFPEKLIPLIIFNALNAKPIPIYGDGQQVRDWLYVEDHCSALLEVLDRGRDGETYNIGGNSPLTNLEVAQSVCAILDERVPDPNGPYERLIAFVEDRPGHDARYAVDCGKIMRELGWQQSVTFADGLRRTVDWYLDHQAWLETINRTKYGGERLGVSAQTGASRPDAKEV